MLRSGMYLQNRYEILEQIGSGGMSEVYKARCHKLNRLVAIKVLKAEFSDDASFVSKFKIEAQAAAGLSHPNVVSVYDVVDEGVLHYIVMELIEGITLKNYICKKGRLDVREAIGIAIQVAQGMAAAHEQHIIHRDIKPQNMIISRDGKVKVADFGIARAVSSQTIGATAMGSVHYISPEQARGGYSDERSDIYSLGITIYEMVTGHVPFDGENTVTVALAHIEAPLLPPSRLNPAVPPSLEKIILKCTEKKPENRYNNATELISDLRRALVNPGGDFVRTAPQVDDSPTVTISAKELTLIKDGARQREQRDAREPEEFAEPARKQQRKIPVRHRDDDVNPQIERLLTGVGVVVAIIIVAVLLFIVSQLTGLFNKGSGVSPTVIATEGAAGESASLSDTETYMPDVVGMSLDEAEKLLAEHDLTVKLSYAESEDYAKDTVIGQNPAKDTVVAKHSAVTLTVSEGTDKISLDEMNLLSMTAEDAKALLEGRRLTVNVTEEFSETAEKGTILRYEPASAAPGGTVTLYVSAGPEMANVKVPTLLGHTAEEAAALLTEAGLVAGEVTEETSETVAKGLIVSQSAEPDSELPQGSAVHYVLSLGKASQNQPKYYATIREEYSFKNVYGPGAAATNIDVMIRFKQTVNGQTVTRTLMEPRNVSGAAILPINYTIEGAPGVLTGTLEVVNATDNTVLKSYPLEFYEAAQ